jgi:phosphate transport system protein
MKIHLQTEIDRLKKKLFHLSTLVEESLDLAVRAISEHRGDLAGEVIGRDKEIDQLEVELEEDCLKILALHQPVAADLRFLITILKMNNDLERIGDLAVNISNGKLCLADDTSSPEYSSKLLSMGNKAKAMLRNSLQALIDLDIEKARAVLLADDEVDAEYRAFVGQLKEELGGNAEKVDLMVCWMMVSKHLERVADLATNIGEDTIYTITGEIVRHGGGR